MPRTVKKKTTTAKRKAGVERKVALVTKETASLSSKPKTRIPKYLAFALILVIVLGLAYLAKGLFIAAVVNGRPVSRLTLIKNLEKAQGKTTLDNLITEELISQEAKKEHIVVSVEDVQKEIDKLTKSVESQGSTLDAALATRGMTKTDLEKNIKIQKTVEALLAPQLLVSDDEIKKYFEDNKDIYGANAKFEDLKDSVKGDLQQEKFSSEFQKWYQKLQAESDIKYLISF